MAIALNKRYSVILRHLHADLEPFVDYAVTDGVLTWLNESVNQPTVTAMNNIREEATDAWWWKKLRARRDKCLHQSDWSQGADVPDATKSAWATYREKLRNLPKTVSKPAFSVLDDKETGVILTDIIALMPTKPS